MIGNRAYATYAVGAWIDYDNDELTAIEMDALNFEANVCIDLCRYGAFFATIPMIIKNSTFKDNTALTNAGLAAHDNRLELQNVTFSKNIATFSSSGALSFGTDEQDPGYLKVKDCTFTENKSEESTGGAINLELVGMGNLTLQIENSIFQGNEANKGSCIFISRDIILENSYIKE